MDMLRKMVIAGGTGTIGGYLINHFRQNYEEIIVLSRKEDSVEDDYRIVSWNAKDQGAWSKELDGADVVINLTGKSIQTRFTEENKKLLYSSRVDSTKAIGTAISNCKQPPRVWINASGAAIYPPTIDRANDETVKEVGQGFKAGLSVAWENAVNGFTLPETRSAIIRITPVLNAEDGFLPPIKIITRLGLGGPQGRGDQMVSWIHIEDLCRAIEFIIARDDLSGPINLASPHPIANKTLMRSLRKVLKVPIGLPAPAFAIKLGSVFTGVDPSLILDSSNVIPGRLTASGFEFKYPQIEDSLRSLI